jgi:hypothetical protein
MTWLDWKWIIFYVLFASFMSAVIATIPHEKGAIHYGIRK